MVAVVPLVLMLLGDRRGRADRQRHGSADHRQDESHRVPQLAFCLPTGLADGLAGPGIDRSSRYKGGKAPDSPQYRGLVVAEPGKTATAGVDLVAQTHVNPYTEARREWNERYGDYIQQARHWRMMAIISGLAALVAVIGIAYIGAQGKIVPYVVQVDKLGEAAAVSRAGEARLTEN